MCNPVLTTEMMCRSNKLIYTCVRACVRDTESSFILSHPRQTCLVSRLEPDGLVGSSANPSRGAEAHPANGHAVPVSPLGDVHRLRGRLSRGHVIGGFLRVVCQCHVRSQHLQAHLQAEGGSQYWVTVVKCPSSI